MYWKNPQHHINVITGYVVFHSIVTTPFPWHNTRNPFLRWASWVHNQAPSQGGFTRLKKFQMSKQCTEILSSFQYKLIIMEIRLMTSTVFHKLRCHVDCMVISQLSNITCKGCIKHFVSLFVLFYCQQALKWLWMYSGNCEIFHIAEY